MTTPPSPEPPDAERPSREDLDRQVRERYATWRDQPRGLGCAVVAAFLVLTTVAFVLAGVAIIAAAR
ncbi:hypothetical protein E1264_42690 [Actinomadura sp. KC216]|uniref:hypothetical protein n=1 Tax=Actinomadura sp. KC216 TaxID=2530370 RepID=UPI00104EB4BB|nr:hypothetical protein [Actinomadura sp. KC216]TDB70972.1 hypothetical protein E1264_42690 [Actinomadura sp. KC216]